MEVKILQGVTPFEIELRVNEFLARTPYQVAEDIEILASMAHPDREIIAGLAESRKRLSTLAAWLQHVREEAE